MRLQDSVTLWHVDKVTNVATKATVMYQSVEEIVETGTYTGVRTVDRVTALIPAAAMALDDIDRIDWRGSSYTVLDQAKVFRRRGRDHHYQIRLQREA